MAPRGTVDAGAAGMRVSGNLNIAALQVLNAFNIQVQGVTVGIPTGRTEYRRAQRRFSRFGCGDESDHLDRAGQ